MIEAGRQLRFGEETLAISRVLREIRGQELQRDVPAQAQIFGEVDDAHPALAQQLLDAVPAYLVRRR
jgi:hypothetical protein